MAKTIVQYIRHYSTYFYSQQKNRHEVQVF